MEEKNNNTVVNNGSCTTVLSKTNKSAFPPLSLPPEILVNIFNCFSDSAKELLLFAQVNQSWHHIVTSFYIWHTVRFNKFETFSRFHEVLQLIARTRRNQALDNWSRLVTVCLNTIEPSTSEENEVEDDKNVRNPISLAKPTYFHSTKFYGHFVRRLDLSRIDRKYLITEKMLCDLFPNIPNLQYVNLYNFYAVTDKVIEKLTKSCHRLEKLKLFGCTSLTNKSLYWIEMGCLELISLNIGFCIVITPYALQSLITRCKKLTSLNISHCVKSSADCLIPMVKNLQGLRKLYMHRSFTSDLIVKNIISQIPRLHKLDLGASNPKLTDESAEIISQHCPNLVHLSLSFSLITNQGLSKIAQGCRKLSFIDLSGCDKIHGNGISNFLNHCIELKTIHYESLSQISEKGFLAIIKSNHVEYASFTGSKISDISTNYSFLSDGEKSCSKIKKLVLDDCEISGENLRWVAYVCKNLEYLSISLVYNIDDELLQFLCDNLEHLKEIIAQNCYNIRTSKQKELIDHQRIKFIF